MNSSNHLISVLTATAVVGIKCPKDVVKKPFPRICTVRMPGNSSTEVPNSVIKIGWTGWVLQQRRRLISWAYAQIKTYSCVKFRCKPASIGISFEKNETQAWRYHRSSHLKGYLFGIRPYSGRPRCLFTTNLWHILEKQLKTECWYCVGCGHPPI